MAGKKKAHKEAAASLDSAIMSVGHTPTKPSTDGPSKTNENPPDTLERKGVEVLEVDRDGLLAKVNWPPPERRHMYSVGPECAETQLKLVEATEDCEPLLWEIQRIYSDHRALVDLEIRRVDAASEATSTAVGSPADREAQLSSPRSSTPEDFAANSPSELRDRARQRRSWLDRFDADPEIGAIPWLQALDQGTFDREVRPEVVRWFDEVPDLEAEDAFLPALATASGVATIGLDDLGEDLLERLGIDLYEQSSFSCQPCAYLTISIDEANAIAESEGAPIRFVASGR